ncbi:MAG TPA: HDIG domain-containing protein [Pyrinomonadaceae bacterium]|nr:HDIG domain-containing protein [Pyrinomonadaceae bacterium]
MSRRRPGRRPRFTSRFAAWRERIFAHALRPLYWFRPTTRLAVSFALLTLVTTLLLVRSQTPAAVEHYKEGEVVRADVIAPADISTEDAHETERRRVSAMSAARPVWSYDPARNEAAVQSFRTAWETLRQEYQTRRRAPEQTQSGADDAARRASDARREADSNNSTPTPAPTEAMNDLRWPGTNGGGEAAIRAVAARRFDAGVRESLAALLREAGGGYVYDDSYAQNVAPAVRLVNVSTGEQSDITDARERLTPLSAARQALRQKIARLPGWSAAEREALASVLVPLVGPTVVFNAEATDTARAAAASSVPPVYVALKRNQMVAREGDAVTRQMLSQFNAIRSYSRTERRPQHFVGLLVIVAALYWAAYRFVEYRSTITALPIARLKAFALVCTAILIELVLMRAGFVLAESIAEHSLRHPLNDPSLWSFAVPFAAGALLVTLLVDSQLALITAVLTAIFAGLLGPGGMLITCYAMVSSSAAIYTIGRYRERHSVTMAGVFVGVINAAMALAVLFSAQQPLTYKSVLLALGCGALGGLLTAAFTALALPVNESFFGILTDIKLLELSNADLPVLGQLALRAPGTNQHSHAVGQLAEEACRAIGANPLLARIGALYHDIGKVAAPEMFVENQTGDNPHDRLKPQQSARIITSHVTYGLKLAKEIGLPRQIADFIPQHHGTRTLHFFLRKAQAHAADGEVVDEKEFRYPGPKPQFKEAAIMMLADSCEAAARSLARPDPENVRVIVAKIVDAIVSDGQLDECDLSLRELTKVRESIITSLVAIYHARIDYPGFNPPTLDPTKPLDRSKQIHVSSSGLDSEERGITYSRPSEIPISKGGEVEDEAVTKQ